MTDRIPFISSEYLVTRVNFYTREKIQGNIYPCYPVNPLSDNIGWKSWEDKKSPNFLNVKNLFHKLEITSIDTREQGGRAYKVNLFFKDEEGTERIALVDLREDVMLDIFNIYGVLKGGIIKGNFTFRLYNGMKLVIAPNSFVENFSELDLKTLNKLDKKETTIKNRLSIKNIYSGIYTKALRGKKEDVLYFATNFTHYTKLESGDFVIRLNGLQTDNLEERLTELFNNKELLLENNNYSTKIPTSFYDKVESISDEDFNKISKLVIVEMGNISNYVLENMKDKNITVQIMNLWKLCKTFSYTKAAHEEFIYNKQGVIILSKDVIRDRMVTIENIYKELDCLNKEITDIYIEIQKIEFSYN